SATPNIARCRRLIFTPRLETSEKGLSPYRYWISGDHKLEIPIVAHIVISMWRGCHSSLNGLSTAFQKGNAYRRPTTGNRINRRTGGAVEIRLSLWSAAAQRSEGQAAAAVGLRGAANRNAKVSCGNMENNW